MISGRWPLARWSESRFVYSLRGVAIGPAVSGQRKSMPAPLVQPTVAGPADGSPTCRNCECLRERLEQALEREARLRAQVAEFQRTLFGRKSETTPPPDSLAGSSAADEAAPDTASGDQQPGDGPPDDPSRRKRGRQPGSPTPAREQRPDLPAVLEVLDVPEQDRRCPACGTAYVPSGSKISWLYEMDWGALARKILRRRYRPACHCAAAQTLMAPPAPRLGQTQLGTSVWAWCLVQVYALFRPQASVARDLEALTGLRIPLATLSQGLRRLSHLCTPLDEAIGQRQQQAAVAQADETSCPVQAIACAADNKDPPQRGQKKPKHWLWVCLTADTVRMRILPTRGLDSALQLLVMLLGAGPVILMCDRYSVYKALARLYPGRIIPVYGWSHVRRDYRRTGTGHPCLQAWSEVWIARIGRLFELNRKRLEAWRRDQPLGRQNAQFQRWQRELEAVVEALFRSAQQEASQRAAEWILQSWAAQPDGAALARLDAQERVLNSLLQHREGLIRFVSDPRIPLDNNAAERALRGPVIARHTSFGSGGPDGARAAGLLFGILQTVRLAGLNPYAWMLDWLQACAREGGQAPRNLNPWLPWPMSPSRRQALGQAPEVGCPELDPRIVRLPSTTFFGRRLTRRQIGDIQETVVRLPLLSRTELGYTICEHLGWHSARGRPRVQLAMRLLEELERLGILTLPAKKGPGRGSQRPLQPGARSEPQPALEGPLDRLEPIRLRLVVDSEEVARLERMGPTLPPTGLPPALRRPSALLPRRRQRTPAGLPAVRLCGAPPAGAGPLDRLAGPVPPPASGPRRAPGSLPAAALGACPMPGVEEPGAEPAPAGRRLAAGARSPSRIGRNIYRRTPAQGHLLPGLELALPGADPSAESHGRSAGQDAQGGVRVPAAEGLAGRPAGPVTDVPLRPDYPPQRPSQGLSAGGPATAWPLKAAVPSLNPATRRPREPPCPNIPRPAY